jgi:N,N'-diacetyllegionaminate synthase
VASSAIKKGDILSMKNISIRRPGNGITPMRWDEIIGMTAQKDYIKDELI